MKAPPTLRHTGMIRAAAAMEDTEVLSFEFPLNLIIVTRKR